MLSIIVVSYNTREITRECLGRIARAVEQLKDRTGQESEVIVVDNASTDGSVEMLRSDYGQFRLMLNQKNTGYAAANNQGMKVAKGDYILILNSDTLLFDNTLTDVWNVINKHGEIDVLGCKLVNREGEIQGSWGYFPNLKRILLLMWFLDNLPGVKRIADTIHVRDLRQYDKQKEVDWVMGAWVLLKKGVFTKTSGLDENYFMYGEEMEWMYRIKKAGFKIWYSPECKAIHLGGASSPSKESAIIGEMKGWLYWFKKHNPRWEQAILPWIIISGCLLRIVLKPKLSGIYFKALKQVWGVISVRSG